MSDACDHGVTERAKLVLYARQAGVRDQNVLTAVESIPRDLFVAEAWLDSAYRDEALPIACGQTISQPSLVALMTEALGVSDRMRVLEIGTGSGYQTAVLAKLCRRVYTIEMHRELLQRAEQRFDALKLRNITTRVGDGARGWPELAPFERIMVTAAAPEIPAALMAQLDIGGCMIIPVGAEHGDQMLCRVTKDEAGARREDLLPVRFVPLVSATGDGDG